ncbi:MAG: response regulator, partial [Candidatus Wallbacteria bacterium]|nr:response regulator [Candidatus Wallbacteria bacterium]
PPAPVIAVIDPAALQQSLLYLAAHSRDAMPGGGEFSVEVDSAIVQSSEVQPAAGHPSENCVHIRVADTSPAMTDWQRRHFFEPYATLDGSARGSGLGLAAVYGFVKQSGGDLEVSCRPGHGTLLDIYLPALAGLQALDERGAVDRVRPSAAATILLVEDEPEVRNLARRILEHCGYSVLVAEGGEAALAMARQHPGPIDLLLSDVRMPDASGPGLALELASSRPEMKVLFMSGHTGANPGEPNELAGAGRLLAKPFTPEVLELQVLEVLCLSARPLPRS